MQNSQDYILERKLLHDIVNELAIIKMAMFLGKSKTEDPTLTKLLVESENAVKKIEGQIQNYRDMHIK